MLRSNGRSRRAEVTRAGKGETSSRAHRSRGNYQWGGKCFVNRLRPSVVERDIKKKGKPGGMSIKKGSRKNPTPEHVPKTKDSRITEVSLLAWEQ